MTVPTIIFLLLNAKVLWGRAFFYRQVLNDFVDWLLKAPAVLFRCAINFSRYSFGLGRGPLAQLKEVKNLRARALLGGSLALGYLLYLRDRRALRNT